MPLWRTADEGLGAAWLTALVAAGAWLSVAWAAALDASAALWIPGGILCAFLLFRPRARWPAYCAWSMVADVAGQRLAGMPWGLASALSICHLAEVLGVALWIRRAIPDVRDPRHWGQVGRVATVATLLACALSGALAVAVHALLTGSASFQMFLTWYGAHVLGMVIVGTTAWVLHVERLGAMSPPGRQIDLLLGMLLLAVVAGLAFLSGHAVLFLTYPPLLMVAFRHRFVGAASGVSLLSLIAMTLTAAGHGPFAQGEISGGAWRIPLLQLYLAGGCLITIPVVLAIAERERLNARLRESEQRYRLLADFSGDLVVRLDASGMRTYVSPSARDMLGWPPEDMLGARWDLLHPDDRPVQRQAMDEVLASGLPQTHRYRVRHRDGHYVWTEVVMRSAPSGSGGQALILSGRDISKRVAAELALEASRRELERLTMIDPLTGIANRRQLEHRLARALARLSMERCSVALFFLDIDHFKGVNDTHGHASGDAVIRAFAQRLQMHTGSGLAVRLGGDEFVVLLDGEVTQAAAASLARRILVAARAPMRIGERTLTVTTSIGIAFASAPVSEDDLLSAADEALYKAKQRGRDRHEMTALGEPDGSGTGHVQHPVGGKGIGRKGKGARWGA